MTNFIRGCFLKSMCLIYVIAFGSLYCQSPGLYGDNGILPARLVVSPEPKSWNEFISSQPTLLSFAGRLGLTTQQGFELLCLIGIAISIMSFLTGAMCGSISFAVLWALYFSLYQVGQTFMWFQWDILLLETGILCIIVSLDWSFVKCEPYDRIGMFMVRWLLFRLMFSSGVVKLTSDCPTWWGLTALDWHYESQCIPTPLAWYIHQLPSWFQRLSVMSTFLIEIPVPFLFFSPIRNLRLFSFYLQLLLQFLIIITGNYNFFNLLTIALCLSLLDDKDLPSCISKTGTGYTSCGNNSISNLCSKLKVLCSFGVYGYLIYGIISLFGLSLHEKRWEVQSRVVFSREQYYDFLRKAVPLGIYIGLASFIWNVLNTSLSCLRMKGKIMKLWSLVGLVGVCVASSSIFVASLVPYTSIHSDSYSQLPEAVKDIHDRMSGFGVVNSYGLFRSMTGVGGRPEVVIEGSETASFGSWREYEFLYKPGNVSRRPPFVAPHQPRLDWQMWFAALGSYQHNPWFINLVYRLLTNEPAVIELLEHNPFPRHPPKYIRATSYLYHYTTLNHQKSKTTPWWYREVSEEYLPPVSLEDTGFVAYLRRSGIIGRQPKQRSRNTLTHLIKSIRTRIGQPEGFSFVIGLLITTFVLRILKSSVAVY